MTELPCALLCISSNIERFLWASRCCVYVPQQQGSIISSSTPQNASSYLVKVKTRLLSRPLLLNTVNSPISRHSQRSDFNVR